MGIKGGLSDMLERAGLIILGFALVILGIHLLGQAESAKTYVSNQGGGGKRTEEEAEDIDKPQPATTREVKSHEKAAAKASKGVGAEEAVEAAAIA